MRQKPTLGALEQVPLPATVSERRILEGWSDWNILSPFDLSRILPVAGSLVVLSSLPGLPVVRLFMKVVLLTKT